MLSCFVCLMNVIPAIATFYFHVSCQMLEYAERKNEWVILNSHVSCLQFYFSAPAPVSIKMHQLHVF